MVNQFDQIKEVLDDNNIPYTLKESKFLKSIIVDDLANSYFYVCRGQREHSRTKIQFCNENIDTGKYEYTNINLNDFLQYIQRLV